MKVGFMLYLPIPLCDINRSILKGKLKYLLSRVSATNRQAKNTYGGAQ